MKKAIVSVSILGATPQNVDKEIARIKQADIKWVHFDVMDGKFVKNTSFDSDFLKNVCSNLDLIKDVHIMINEPIKRIEEYADCGSDYLTFHYEACKDDSEVMEVIDKIHSLNMKAGLSIRPKTLMTTVCDLIRSSSATAMNLTEPMYDL